jgi:hypothetical protein
VKSSSFDRENDLRFQGKFPEYQTEPLYAE